MKIKDPLILTNLFSTDKYLKLRNHLFNIDKSEISFDMSMGRYTFNDPLINDYHQEIVDLAREIFDSPTLIPSYALFSHYETRRANLFMHKDDNACTYTIDMCVYQTEPWDLIVDGKPYTLFENQALAYYGNDQEHGRPKFPNPETQKVAMIFFHFVEPDHWWNTKGQSYVRVVRGNMSEEDWLKENANK